MLIKNNPFTSSVFTDIWKKHFLDNSKKNNKILFFEGVNFYKLKNIPLYINLGKNLTKGLSYRFLKFELTKNNFGNKVFLIYDVPDYFKVKEEENVGCYKARQYEGFLVDLRRYDNFTDYFNATFRKSSRYKLKKYKKRLEVCFDISYKMYLGKISKDNYDYIFDKFENLLQKRFTEKNEYNNNLDVEEWQFYKEVVYLMILENKASLFVIYDGDIPIGVTLCYYSDKVLFDAITVFDIDYAKFNLGSITIMKLLDWSFSNDIQIFDFSKGYFDYKKRWATKSYNFSYHLIYNKKSFISIGIAALVYTYFVFKQNLREKNINNKLHKLKYLFKSKTSGNHFYTYSIKDVDAQKINFNKLKVTNENEIDDNQRKAFFDFLYLNIENKQDIQLFKLKNKDFIIKGRQAVKKVVFI